MDRITEKEVAPYYPYGLTFKCKNFKKPRKLESFNSDEEVTIFAVVKMQYKPYLRPLSDLYKEITLDNTLCYPYKVLGIPLDMAINFKDYSYENMPYKVIRQMFEWHFDVFGLIPKGLAEIKKD